MAWKGTIFGALLGFAMTGRPLGALIGALLGLMFDQSVGAGFVPSGASSSASVSQVFFRTTFELMGHVAKSDGRVTEAEIDAARRLMQDLRLGPDEVAAAIDCFRTGKSAAYDASFRVEQLREACGLRYDLLSTFIELQLRAALEGNGLSQPARAVLMRAAERPLSDWYAELEIVASASDQEVTKAYRRQMSRHHPDKLVANGLPESMAQWAKQKTQRVQEAYEAIRAARGMR